MAVHASYMLWSQPMAELQGSWILERHGRLEECEREERRLRGRHRRDIRLVILPAGETPKLGEKLKAGEHGPQEE